MVSPSADPYGDAGKATVTAPSTPPREDGLSDPGRSGHDAATWKAARCFLKTETHASPQPLSPTATSAATQEKREETSTWSLGRERSQRSCATVPTANTPNVYAQGGQPTGVGAERGGALAATRQGDGGSRVCVHGPSVRSSREHASS